MPWVKGLKGQSHEIFDFVVLLCKYNVGPNRELLVACCWRVCCVLVADSCLSGESWRGGSTELEFFKARAGPTMIEPTMVGF